jgi:hypothetical protein
LSMRRDLYVTGTFPSLIADRITVHVKSEVKISSDLLLAILPDLTCMSKTNPRFYLIVKKFTIIISY